MHGLYSNIGTDGLGRIYHEEGPRGWWRGTSLALFGVTNGALQFMFYEEMKKRAFAFQRARKGRDSVPWDRNKEKLVRETSGCLLEQERLNNFSQTRGIPAYPPLQKYLRYAPSIPTK